MYLLYGCFHGMDVWIISEMANQYRSDNIQENYSSDQDGEQFRLQLLRIWSIINQTTTDYTSHIDIAK